MLSPQQITDQTKKWITDVVIGCSFCPFAARIMMQNSAHFQVEMSADEAVCLDVFLKEVRRMDENTNIETGFVIFPKAFREFEKYLDGVSVAEHLLKQHGYEGIYQVASFHPGYLFADSTEEDPANYTNRSLYPMLQLLRETSIDKALEAYPMPENIPAGNISFARNKGLGYMKMLLDRCYD